MSEEETLRKAVLDDPDDDNPRLAYADWCGRQAEEPTQARAEFIRTQIKIARTDREILNRGGAYELQSRARELQDDYGDVWAAPLASVVEFYAFQRGFIGLVGMSARNFLAHAAQVFAAAPIQHLDLSGVREVNEQLFTSPYLSKLRSLAMDRCGLYNIHLQMLAASPQAAPLRWLSVAENNLGMEGAEALAASAHLKALKYAEFAGNPVDPVEQLGMDSGVVVAAWLPPEGEALEKRHGHLPWLHREGAETSRFIV